MTIAKQIQEPLIFRGKDVLPAFERLESWFVHPNPNLHNQITNLIRAWSNGAILDENGCPWIAYPNLPEIVRISPICDLVKFRPLADEMDTYQGQRFLRGSRVSKYLDFVETSEDSDISLCGDISRELYLMIRNSRIARQRQENCLETHAELTLRLRDQRIRAHRLMVDELTGEKLRPASANFVYLRAPSLFPEWVDEYRNGVVVSEQTFQEISKARPRALNERELFKLCYLKGWNRDWYKEMPFAKPLSARNLL